MGSPSIFSQVRERSFHACAQQCVQRTWWWAVPKSIVQAKAFSVSTVDSPTKPLTWAVGRCIQYLMSGSPQGKINKTFLKKLL